MRIVNNNERSVVVEEPAEVFQFDRSGAVQETHNGPTGDDIDTMSYFHQESSFSYACGPCHEKERFVLTSRPLQYLHHFVVTSDESVRVRVRRLFG